MVGNNMSHFWKIFNDFVVAFLIIAFALFLTMLIMTTGCAPNSNQKPEAPKNHAPTLDSVIAVDWDTILSKDPDMMYLQPQEYHGKEGKSEYGEYEPNNRDTIWE